jgi:hypothetical protein
VHLLLLHQQQFSGDGAARGMLQTVAEVVVLAEQEV